MLKYQRAFWLFMVFAAFPGIIPAATQSSPTFTWFNQNDTSVVSVLDAMRCMDAVGTQDLNVTVFKFPTGNKDSNALVTAVVEKPGGDTNNITFNNAGDGNYTFTYTFDANGTYLFKIHVADTNAVNSTHDLNEYIYVKSFSIVSSFINNNASYSPGDTVTIRNLVQNDDGNSFNDINGLVTVLKPNASTLHSNQTMSFIGDGEYTFSFLAPSTTGTYTATSTFSCNSQSDSNSMGRFTVAAASSTETTTTTTTIINVGGGGGGSGGGGGTSSEGLKAVTRGFDFDELELGVAATASLLVSHGIPNKTNFLVQMQVLRGEKLEFYTEERVPFLEPGKAFRVSFAEKWVPKAAGTYVVTITLSSPDKMIKYDVQTTRYDIEGIPRYDLEAICSQPAVTAGLPYDFNIVAYNLGDYYEDVDLSWWVEDEKNQKIGFSSTPLAVFPGDSIERKASIFIPNSTKPGTYTARVRLDFKEVTRDAFCSFTVQSPQIYYGDVLSELEEQVNKLEADLEEKARSGYVTDYLIERTSDLKKKISTMKQKAANFDYLGLNEDIAETIVVIDEIEELSVRLERDASLELVGAADVLYLVIGVILLIYLAQIIYPRVPRIKIKGGRRKGLSLEQRIEKLLGLDD